MPKKTIELIDIKNILTDKGTQSRVTLDQHAIKDYTKDLGEAFKVYEEKAKDKSTVSAEDFLENVDPFPPIEVYRDAEGHIYLTDGFHRLNSHRDAGYKQIKSEIIEGTLRDAILRSTAVNQGHGVRRSQKDKRRAIDILLADKEWSEKSNLWIASHAGVSEFLVRSMRPATQKSSTRTVRTKTGGSTKAKTGNMGKKGAGKKSAAKKSGKTDGATDEKKGLSKDDERALTKIAKNIGDLGPAFEKAVREGTRPMTSRELKDFAGFSEKTALKIAPLVIERNMSPAKAFAFLNNALADKVLEDLELRAIACGGKYELVRNGFKLTFEKV